MRNRVNVWSLQEIPRLKDLLFAVKDEAKLNLVTSVLQAIDVDVLPNLGSLRKGMLVGLIKKNMHNYRKKCNNVHLVHYA